MPRLQGTVSTLLLIALMIPLGGAKGIATPQASTEAERLLAQAQGTPQPTPQQQPLSWWNLFRRIFTPNPPVASKPGGSRGGICLISPAGVGLVQGSSTPIAAEAIPQVWSPRPLFLWQGRAVRIEVRSRLTQELMWGQPVSPEGRQVTYTGNPLQPGQVYDGVLIDQLGEVNPFSVRLMQALERDRITTELAALEAQLKAKGATTEEIALQRANYFEQQQLPSEVLREAFSLPNPPTELSRLRSQVYRQFCNSAVSE